MKFPVAVSFASGGELVSYKNSQSATNPPTRDSEVWGAVASAFVDFSTPPSNVEYNCLINVILDPSGCYTMDMQYFGDVSLGHMIMRA
ncbi:hypothetical protein MKW92_010902 [Papaver armeniacum]|nr:hypothetical protein MKW92_010902 [Papaver armeniacum]